jgi:hypothetical protein
MGHTDDEVAAHEKSSIGLLLVVWGAVVEDQGACILLLLHDLVQFRTVAVHLRQRQRSEVLVVALVHQDLNNESMLTLSMLKK